MSLSLCRHNKYICFSISLKTVYHSFDDALVAESNISTASSGYPCSFSAFCFCSRDACLSMRIERIMVELVGGPTVESNCHLEGSPDTFPACKSCAIFCSSSVYCSLLRAQHKVTRSGWLGLLVHLNRSPPTTTITVTSGDGRRARPHSSALPKVRNGAWKRRPCPSKVSCFLIMSSWAFIINRRMSNLVASSKAIMDDPSHFLLT
mmetsp:Transcript_37605/g.91247  ORF Transcript_37605/g.91247 Transcript_37605/m.91247 type:complete len:206 (+) Transcript_37605:83-700(+)